MNDMSDEFNTLWTWGLLVLTFVLDLISTIHSN